MKKLATLLIAAGLVFGASTGASAIDFKASGQWLMSFDYGKNGRFTGGNGTHGWDGTPGNANSQDQFEAGQRVRLQLDAVASEALSGTLYFEIGNTLWGQARNGRGVEQGGALGADGRIIEVRRAYIDWMPPETDLKIRMGLQGLGLPNYTMGKSQVFEDDVAAITLSYQFNENVGLTVFWARPYNDNYGGTATGRRINYMDNMDMGGLVLPLTFDGFKVTPYFMMAGIGPNTTVNGATSAGQTLAGMYPAWGYLGSRNQTVPGWGPNGVRNSEYATAWWAGIGIDCTYWDPFHVALDFAAGGVSYESNRMNRAGWGVSLLAEYKMDWGIPGLVAWYYSGDDGDIGNGSERLPYASLGNGDNDFSSFAFDGNKYIAREGVIGNSMAGTWGVGLRVKDVSFIEDLKHTFRINYIGGTNSPKLLKKLHRLDRRGWLFYGMPAAGRFGNAATNIGVDNLYMTRCDSALEFGLHNEYKMYENFTVAFDASYIALWLDNDRATWRGTPMNGRDRDVRDAWNLNVTFAYEF